MKQETEAHKVSNRKHYAKNRDKVMAAVAKKKQEKNQFYQEYKSTLSCSNCGFSHPAALDFHHTNPEEKELSVATMQNRGYGKARILAEIAKCVVLCANCHRILHHDTRLRSLMV